MRATDSGAYSQAAERLGVISATGDATSLHRLQVRSQRRQLHRSVR